MVRRRWAARCLVALNLRRAQTLFGAELNYNVQNSVHAADPLVSDHIVRPNGVYPQRPVTDKELLAFFLHFVDSGKYDGHAGIGGATWKKNCLVIQLSGKCDKGLYRDILKKLKEFERRTKRGTVEGDLSAEEAQLFETGVLFVNWLDQASPA